MSNDCFRKYNISDKTSCNQNDMKLLPNELFVTQIINKPCYKYILLLNRFNVIELAIHFEFCIYTFKAIVVITGGERYS